MLNGDLYWRVLGWQDYDTVVLDALAIERLFFGNAVS